MILDEIVLHNFGLYAERQAVALTPPGSGRSIILFGGLNGHGKTTLLDAVQLCLYGPFAKISNRNGLAYQDYLARSVHRGSDTREAAVELAFRHTIDGKEDRFRLHRSWRKGASGYREHFEVIKNRHRDDALAENWISQVEDLIPPNIANLFLFDGEQVQGYAARDSSMQLIGTAIRNLLGLDVVDQLEKDLQTYQRRKRGEDKDDTNRSEIEKSEAALKVLRARISELSQEQATLKSTRLDSAHKDLCTVEEEYRNLGGELYEKRVEIEQDAEEAERALDESAARLREIAAGDLPLLMVRSLLDGVLRRDLAEEETRRSRDVSAVLDERDERLLGLIRDRGVSVGDLEAIAAYLDVDREMRRRAGGLSTVLDLPPDVRSDLRGLDDRLDEIERKAGSELARWTEARDRADHVRTVQAGVPVGDAVSEIASRRDELVRDIAALEADYAAKQGEIDRLQREVERGEQALSRLLEADAKAEGLRQDRVRILRHAARVRTTLGMFRKAVIVRHVRKIELLVLESYQQLLHKASLVTSLEIDPETFALTLYGQDGCELSTERLSVGERQLLAIALLWGLAKTSGRPLPTAIDTPLGRLDAGHRTHLVERYFPFASHQVLLFSTDEEIVGAHLEKLSPFIGRSYRLAYDDTSGSTRIEEGYFDGAEAT